MKKLVITSEIETSATKDKKKEVKTRSFTSFPLCWITANDLWDGGKADKVQKNDVIRPVFLMTGGTDSEMRSFVANLRTGREAQVMSTGYGGTYQVDKKMEFLKKSQTYRWTVQRVDEVRTAQDEPLTVVTVYNPELFVLDPGLIDRKECKFVSAIPDWWIERELEGLLEDRSLCGEVLEYAREASIFSRFNLESNEQILSLIPQATYFCAYLDKRTKLSLVNDLGFQLDVFLSALSFASNGYPNGTETNIGWARTSTATIEKLKEVGLTAFAYYSTQDELKTFLEQRIGSYGEVQRRLDLIYPERVEQRTETFKRQAERAAQMRKRMEEAEVRQKELRERVKVETLPVVKTKINLNKVVFEEDVLKPVPQFIAPKSVVKPAKSSTVTTRDTRQVTKRRKAQDDFILYSMGL